jgi:hypothetical protein
MNLITRIACAKCHVVLTEHRNGDTVVYQHPVGRWQHEPVPINAELLEAFIDRCHLCADGLPAYADRSVILR